MTPCGGRGTVTVLGSINMDTVFRVTHPPIPGATVMATAMTRHPGGKGLNQAIAAARAGAAVRMAGAIGDDADGRAMRALLEEEGIDSAELVTDGRLPTGAAFVTVDDRGENQIVVVAGANDAALAPADPAGVRLAQLEVPIRSVAAFLSAPRAGSLAVLNAAPFRPEARSLLAFADVVVVNEAELAGYGGLAAPPSSMPMAAAAAAAAAGALRRHATQTIIVTLGAAGSVAVGPGAPLLIPVPVAEVVDTTGAGDCFCGYLAAGLAAGLALPAAIADAHAAAALAVGRWGAAMSVPRRHELGATARP